MDEKKNRIGLREESIPSSRQEIEENILKELCEMEKHNHSGCVQELCRRIGLSRHEMSYYLKQMVRHGYIYPEEKRDVVRLTEYGRITGIKLFRSFCSLPGLMQRRRMKMPAGSSMWSAVRPYSESVISSIMEKALYGRLQRPICGFVISPGYMNL